MWRSYAAANTNTFTPKRKNISAHSLSTTPTDSRRKSFNNKYINKLNRRSSSFTSSFEEYNISSDQKEEENSVLNLNKEEIKEEENCLNNLPSNSSAKTFRPIKSSNSNSCSLSFKNQTTTDISSNLNEDNNLLEMPPVKDINGINDGKPTANMFEKDSRSDAPIPEMPTTEGIEYPRAASWSSSTVAEIMRDQIGRQVFRCFLHESLAEENLLFVEEVEKMKREKQPEKIRQGIKMLLDKYGQYINLSSVAMSKLREATKSEVPDPKALECAHKEIYKLLENDQFPRFRRSKLYLEFLEQLLPRSYAERWMTSFDALLGNQVGRHHFRQFLFNVHAEENLRFWESVIEFRQLKNKSIAMLNMSRTIQQQFLREGAHNEVFFPFGLRQRVEKKIREKNVDDTVFDEAVKHVEQILKNDPYVRFINSKEYNDLLAKLH
uniref:RGS domain-containing protein n=1 Tax=Meloidogyne enterolobii TaxID=390850 RepID=A0A6V7WKN4_MELEN|nr:unnamed protein product [Meloidogyne enterolobii]